MVTDAKRRLRRGPSRSSSSRKAPGSRPDRAKPYQPGIAALYGQLDVPVVPVALNSGMFWGRQAIVKKAGRDHY